jgi:sulfite exporter TauE/SafE
MQGLAAAAFAAGLLGGVHCAGMCGGIVGSLSAAARGPALPRQLAFNAGRVGSYALAGAIAGALGALAHHSPAGFGMQIALFVLANAVMLLLGLYVAGWGRVLQRLESAGGALWRRLQPLARRLVPLDTTAKAAAAGALWGFVPCGLVYSMLTLALASGDAVSGAAVMAAFGLGTLPNLLAAGFAAQTLLAVRRIPWVRRGAGLAIVALALAGFARIPMISEHLASAWACLG